MTVLDSSAVLAFLQGEPGAELVQRNLEGSVIGAANLSEVLAKLGGRTEASLAEAILDAQGVSVEPVLREDARRAAALRSHMPSLSLGDRLCLALADRLGESVLTADKAWGRSRRIRQIRP